MTTQDRAATTAATNELSFLSTFKPLLIVTGLLLAVLMAATLLAPPTTTLNFRVGAAITAPTLTTTLPAAVVTKGAQGILAATKSGMGTIELRKEIAPIKSSDMGPTLAIKKLLTPVTATRTCVPCHDCDAGSGLTVITWRQGILPAALDGIGGSQRHGILTAKVFGLTPNLARLRDDDEEGRQVQTKIWSAAVTGMRFGNWRIKPATIAGILAPQGAVDRTIRNGLTGAFSQTCWVRELGINWHMATPAPIAIIDTDIPITFAS